MLEMAPKIEALAAEIVDDVCERGECEFVFDVAAKLPVFALCELMGIPVGIERVVELGNAIADVETRKDLSANPVVELAEIAIELGERSASIPMIDC